MQCLRMRYIRMLTVAIRMLTVAIRITFRIEYSLHQPMNSKKSIAPLLSASISMRIFARASCPSLELHHD